MYLSTGALEPSPIGLLVLTRPEWLGASRTVVADGLMIAPLRGLDIAQA